MGAKPTINEWLKIMKEVFPDQRGYVAYHPDHGEIVKGNPYRTDGMLEITPVIAIKKK